MQTVLTLIRCRRMHLIWVSTVCQLLFWGFPQLKWINTPIVPQTKDFFQLYQTAAVFIFIFLGITEPSLVPFNPCSAESQYALQTV